LVAVPVTHGTGSLKTARPEYYGYGQIREVFVMSPQAVLILSLAVVNLPVYYFLYRMLYRDAQEFVDALVFWFKPDLWSALNGEYWDDVWAEMKLGLFLTACSGTVMLEAWLVTTYVLTRA
jgi:hypothetical protein